MCFNKKNGWARWGVLGGFLGGLIALIGLVVFTMMSLPPTDSDLMSWVSFLIPRIIVGSIVAMIMGPILAKKRPKSNSFRF